ncbi:hypothetical protein SMC26_17845 [Actinomadura fulvescens]|uniref:hypothetical protein n=1 Tax=Actinomadura fulvescens TaxID=46160 RepID=UPI0031E042E2
MGITRDGIDVQAASMSGGTSHERERLAALGDALWRDGGVRVEHTGISVHGLTVGRCVQVACHAQPWDGPLYFCEPQPDGDPCRVLGPADNVTQVAGQILRRVRAEAGGVCG